MSEDLPIGTASGAPLVADRYRLVAKLAEGGVGAVYHATDTASGAEVALKQLLPHAGRDRRLRMLFEREYHTLAQLQHPRIIEVFDYGIDSTGPYYTMELLKGRDLGEFAPIPYRKACQYLRDVASCLSLLHTRRLLHRDLSPRNVRSVEGGHCKLLDFGTMASFGVASEVVGTPPLVAPECLRGAALDHRADLYSLGALAYRLLTRRYAFRARRLEDLPELWKQTPPPPSSIVSDIPPELDELVLSLLSLDPLCRPSHTAEVIDRLVAIGALPPEEEGEATAASYLMSTTLVGRDHLLRRLQRRIDRTLKGRGATWLIEGHRGVGKTRMLDEAALLSQLAGSLTVSVRGAELRGTGALGAELVRSLWLAAPSDAQAAAGDDPALIELRERSHLRASRPSRPSNTGMPRVGMAADQARQAVLGWLQRLTLRRPIVLLIDDLHRAPEDALVLLRALSMETDHRPMLVIGTLQLAAVPTAGRALESLREQAVPVRLSRLNEAHTTQLIRSVFGSAPNVTELSARVHGATSGNPMQVLALLQQLLQAGQVRYAAGMWIVPAELADLPMPSDLAETLLSRCATLSKGARELAETCSASGGDITLDLCLALWPDRGHEEVFSELGELVQHDILVSAGDGYAWSQEALREALVASMDTEQRRRCHRRLGQALLAEQDMTPSLEIEAGRHLYLAGDAERGSVMIAGALPHLPPRAGASTAAMPAVEAALAEYLRQGGPARTILRLRIALVMSSMRDVCARHSRDTLRQLAQYAGLPLARRFDRFLPTVVALAGGLLAAWLRRLATPRSHRGPAPGTALTLLVRCLYAVLPVRASSMDLPGLEALLRLAEPLRAVPDIGPVTFDLLRGAVAATAGQQAAAIPYLTNVIERLERNSGLRGASPQARRGILGGAYIALGMAQVVVSIRSDEPLATIERLDEFAADPRFADDESSIGPEGGITATELRRAAQQMRTIFYLRRGETELAELQLRTSVGSDSGLYWQFDLVRTMAEADAAAAALDLVALRRTSTLVEHVLRSGEGDEYVLSHLRDTLEAATLLARNNSSGCIARLRGAARPVGGPPWWERRTTILMAALCQEGRGQEALALGRDALRYLERAGARRSQPALTVRCAVVQANLALQDSKAATAELRILDAALSDSDHPLLLATYHGAAAEVAEARGNAVAVEQHITSAQHWAAITRSPAIIARHQKTANRLQKGPEGNSTQGADADLREPARDTLAAVAQQMAGCRTTEERSRRALLSLLKEAGASGGHLFEGEEAEELMLTASAGGQRPSEELEQRILELFANQVLESQQADPSTASETTMFEVTTTGRPTDAAPLWRVHLLHDHRGQRAHPIAALAYPADEAEVVPLPAAYLNAMAAHLATEPATAPATAPPARA